jgi:hypothetical protein
VADIGIRVEDGVNVGDNVVISMRSYFSSAYLWSAEHHTRRAQDIEDAGSGVSRFAMRHRAYVLDAVTDAAAFVEAAVNEVLQDVADSHGSYVANLGEAAHSSLAKYWAGSSEAKTLDKYDAVLAALGHAKLNRGGEPTQGMQILIRLRNHLIHYKPSDRSSSFPPGQLEQQLTSRGFIDNALMTGSGNAWFPDHAFGAGCARWACDTARAFVDDWCRSLGLQLHYQIVHWDEAP